MVGAIGRREAGDRLATLRETGDSTKIGLSPSGIWEILILCPPYIGVREGSPTSCYPFIILVDALILLIK